MSKDKSTEVPWSRVILYLVLAVVGLMCLYMGLVFVNTAVQGVGFTSLGMLFGSNIEQAIQNHNGNSK